MLYCTALYCMVKQLDADTDYACGCHVWNSSFYWTDAMAFTCQFRATIRPTHVDALCFFPKVVHIVKLLPWQLCLTWKCHALALGGAHHATDAINHLALRFQILGLLPETHDWIKKKRWSKWFFPSPVHILFCKSYSTWIKYQPERSWKLLCTCLQVCHIYFSGAVLRIPFLRFQAAVQKWTINHADCEQNKSFFYQAP